MKITEINKSIYGIVIGDSFVSYYDKRSGRYNARYIYMHNGYAFERRDYGEAWTLIHHSDRYAAAVMSQSVSEIELG